jgi:hypothetical protein
MYDLENAAKRKLATMPILTIAISAGAPGKPGKPPMHGKGCECEDCAEEMPVDTEEPSSPGEMMED